MVKFRAYEFRVETLRSKIMKKPMKIIKSGKRRNNMNEILNVKIPVLKRPTLKELQSKFPWIKSIERDTSPTKACVFNPITVLREGETNIFGKEYEKCLNVSERTEMGEPLLGYQQAVWLVEHQDEFPEFMALLGKVYIDFAGLVVVDVHGDWDFPYLNHRGGRWY